MEYDFKIQNPDGADLVESYLEEWKSQQMKPEMDKLWAENEKLKAQLQAQW